MNYDNKAKVSQRLILSIFLSIIVVRLCRLPYFLFFTFIHFFILSWYPQLTAQFFYCWLRCIFHVAGCVFVFFFSYSNIFSFEFGNVFVPFRFVERAHFVFFFFFNLLLWVQHLHRPPHKHKKKCLCSVLSHKHVISISIANTQ